MATQAETDLTLAAAALASTAPKEWDKFGLALKNYCDQALLEMVAAPNDQLYDSRGRARGLRWLFDQLAKCKADAKKIQEQRAKSP